MTLPANKWSMVTLPVWPAERDDLASQSQWQYSTYPNYVLPGLSTNPSSTGIVWAFDPAAGAYTMTQSYEGWRVKPFRAFWVRYTGGSPVTVTAEGAKAGLKDKHPIEYALPKGWNAVGNPFLDSLPLDASHVKFRLGLDGEVSDLRQAVSKGWIANQIYWLDPDTQTYVGVALPSDANPSPPAHQMPPFRGYWLRSRVDDLYILATLHP